jgi:DNA repair protein RadC
MMPIHEWPTLERPREKLLEKGAHTLSDAELLAIFLRTGVHGRSALDIARELLTEFGGLAAFLEAPAEYVCRRRGVGKAKFAELQASVELAKRYSESRIANKHVLSCPDDTRRFLIARLRGHRSEVFACLFLDSQHRLIRFEELFKGTIDAASVYPREVVARSLALNAAAVILAHNHPSGACTPSEADKALTRRLIDALAVVDIRVLDHIIVGDGEALSFAEHGFV